MLEHADAGCEGELSIQRTCQDQRLYEAIVQQQHSSK